MKIMKITNNQQSRQNQQNFTARPANILSDFYKLSGQLSKQSMKGLTDELLARAKDIREINIRGVEPNFEVSSVNHEYFLLDLWHPNKPNIRNVETIVYKGKNTAEIVDSLIAKLGNLAKVREQSLQSDGFFKNYDSQYIRTLEDEVLIDRLNQINGLQIHA